MVRRQIAEMAEKMTPLQEAEPKEEIVDVASAVTGRSGRNAGRVQTRLLGFQAAEEAS